MRRSRGFAYYRRENRFRRGIRRFILFLAFLYLAFLLASVIVITPYRVRAVSMEPTIPSGGRCLAVPLVYGIHIPFTDTRIPGFNEPRRGDIVICTPPTFRSPPWYIRVADSLVGFFTLGRIRPGIKTDRAWDNGTAIKRIIALPGDSIKMESFVVYIRPQGKETYFSEFEIIQKPYNVHIDPLPEGWLTEFPFSGTSGETTLGPNEYFLLGDNRTSSRDSSLWGPVNRESIRSRVMISYLPGFSFH